MSATRLAADQMNGGRFEDRKDVATDRQNHVFKSLTRHQRDNIATHINRNLPKRSRWDNFLHSASKMVPRAALAHAFRLKRDVFSADANKVLGLSILGIDSN